MRSQASKERAETAGASRTSGLPDQAIGPGIPQENLFPILLKK